MKDGVAVQSCLIPLVDTRDPSTVRLPFPICPAHLILRFRQTVMLDITQFVSNCINANPDIAGVGVRIAIYAQNFLALLLLLVALNDKQATPMQLRVVEAQTTSTLLTTCALLVTAIAQASKFGMSAHHVTIILNLAWMGTNTFTYFVSLKYSSVLSLFTSISRGCPTLPFILGSLHLSLLAGFGLWSWTVMDMPDAVAHWCAPQSPVSPHILGHNVVVSSPAFRLISLIIYGGFAVPGLNVVALNGIINGYASLATLRPSWVLRKRKESLQSPPIPDAYHFLRDRYFLALLLAVNIVIAVYTESIIKQASHFLKPGGSRWTFGQTLALLLLMLPILEIARFSAKGQHGNAWDIFGLGRPFRAVNHVKH